MTYVFVMDDSKMSPVRTTWFRTPDGGASVRDRSSIELSPVGQSPLDLTRAKGYRVPSDSHPLPRSF